MFRPVEPPVADATAPLNRSKHGTHWPFCRCWRWISILDPLGSDPRQFVDDDALYFSARSVIDFTAQELWRFDGQHASQVGQISTTGRTADPQELQLPRGVILSGGWHGRQPRIMAIGRRRRVARGRHQSRRRLKRFLTSRPDGRRRRPLFLSLCADALGFVCIRWTNCRSVGSITIGSAPSTTIDSVGSITMGSVASTTGSVNFGRDLGRVGAVRSLPGRHLPEQPRPRRRKVVRNLGVVGKTGEGGLGSRAWERTSARQRLEENKAECVHVAPRGDLTAIDLLRGHVGGRPDGARSARQRGRGPTKCAMPKSPRRGWSCPSNITFEGFTSRCTTPWPWT